MILVRRASGLLAPFEVPELTMDAAIERSLEMRGGLLLPKRPVYLHTFPKPRWWSDWTYPPARIPRIPRIPWDNSAFPLLQGLPAL